MKPLAGQIVDTYCHVGTSIYEKVSLGLDELVRRMRKYNVVLALVAPFTPADMNLEEANRQLFRACQPYNSMVKCVARIDPRVPTAARRMARLVKSLEFAAVELDPFEQGFQINSEQVMEFLSATEKLNFPIIIRAGYPMHSEAIQIGELGESFRKMRFVMTHGAQLAMHGLGIGDAAKVMQEHDNIYLETSGIPESGKDNLIQRITSSNSSCRRIVFGSDSPRLHIEVELKRLKVLVPTAKFQHMVLCDNALRIFDQKS